MEERKLHSEEDALSRTQGDLLAGSYFDISEVALMKDPDQAISAFIAGIGKTFSCERIYIMEKNEDGGYDCTYEWITDVVYSKKHLLQNLQFRAVRYYYNYFLRGQNLMYSNLEQLKQSDFTLYKILKPQDLTSSLCGMLSINNQDLGFFGIDNPSPERYEELAGVFDIIKFCISSNIHRRNLNYRLKNESRSLVKAASPIQKYSLYDRFSLIQIDQPMALIYCDASLKHPEDSFRSELTGKILSYTESVLGSIYGTRNVFYLGRNEFLIFYEYSDDPDFSDMDRLVALTQRTFDTMNINISLGIASTRKYQADFFDLVHRANIRMLRSKQKYQDRFTEKYHLEAAPSGYLDLIDIRPKTGKYHVLYSESRDNFQPEGDVRSLIRDLTNYITPGDQKRFSDFCESQLLAYSADPDFNGSHPTASATFSQVLHGQTALLEIMVTSYIDVHNEPVIIVYTR